MDVFGMRDLHTEQWYRYHYGEILETNHDPAHHPHASPR
jgi:hypothetical protein